jgi:hypothetical protein
MAVGKTTHVGQRRIVYGANVLIQIVIVLFVVVAVVGLSRNWGQVDLTATGVNSLNPRTVKLLQGLDENVRLTALYTVLSEYDERAQKRQDMVRDLLKLYEAQGHGHVTANLIDPMKDRARTQALLGRLRDKPAYAEEAAEHEKLLESFPELRQAVASVLERQLADAETLVEQNPALEQSVLVEVTQQLRRLINRAAEVDQRLKMLASEEMPQYSAALDVVRQLLLGLQDWFGAVDDWLQAAAQASTPQPPEAVSFMQGVAQDYAPLKAQVDELLEQADALEDLELDRLLSQLNRWASAPPILVETDEKAEVVPFAEVWPFRQGQTGPDGDDREFAGEAAMSSAILKLTQKERTAVVFVRYGGPSPIMPDFSQMNPMTRQMPQAPYGKLNDLLGKENFITHDWNVAEQKEVPEIEGAARRVYVVLPPTPPEQPDPRRPPVTPGISAADVDLITGAVAEAGSGIFLASWVPPQMAAQPGGGTYEFADYLKAQWGIDVRYEYIVLPFAPSRDDTELFLPTVETQQALVGGSLVELGGHPISEPLATLPAGFDSVCPVQFAEAVPAGIESWPVARVIDTDDVWALMDVSRLAQDFRERQGTFPRDGDIRAPFPLAVAAENADGKRVVVYGSRSFVGNRMLELPGGYVLTGGGLQSYAAFPANSDLLINSVYWLTNDADRISVGARKTSVPRLDKLKEGPMLQFWRIFLVVIWPGLALVVGGGVWLMRRR